MFAGNVTALYFTATPTAHLQIAAVGDFTV